MKDNNALIVLGMHRSGTSLLTGLLGQVGVQMGRRLYAPQKGVNEKGFWEHEDIVDTHDELLLQLNSQWDDLLPLREKWWEGEIARMFIARLTKFVQRDFSNAPIWALKDPRMCRLLPLWFPIFTQQQVKPGFIYMNRNPFEVVASLQKRDSFSKEKALILWLDHSLSAELYSRESSRIFIDFDQMIKDPVSVLTRVEQELNLTFPVSAKEASEKINSFVSPDLRHHKVETKEQYQGLSLMAYELYQALNDIPTGKKNSYTLIDRITVEFNTYKKEWNPELLEQIRYLNHERANYRIKFFRIYTSWSWLLVKPLWLIEKIFRKY